MIRKGTIMLRQIGRRTAFTAVVLCLCISGNSLSAAADQAPVTGDVVVDLNFDDGTTQGFAIYTNGGSCDISNEDGSLAVDIHKCGNLDYANQVYWDGFALSRDCVYTYSFDISCSIPRQAEYRLQLNGGDYHAYVSDVISIGPDVQTVSTDWTMADESDPAPRLVFNLGKEEDMAEDPGEHQVIIDNIRLTVKDAANAAVLEGLPEYPALSVNQAGYRPQDRKTAVLRMESTDSGREDAKEENRDGNTAEKNTEDNPEANAANNPKSSTANHPEANAGQTSFRIVNLQTGETAFEGLFSDSSYNRSTQTRVKTADFTELSEPGTYCIHVETESGELTSFPFAISKDVYLDVWRSLVHMLYLQRCGTALTPELAGTFSHGQCHTQEAVIYGTDRTKEVSGGWHDAGDYGRYVVAGAKAAADLMMAYEKYRITADDLSIPESGNGIPDLLDEVRWELEWMLKMQDPDTGGVYHKVTGYAFPGDVPPEEETDTLVIAPVSTAATGDFAAVMAKASTVFMEIDPSFSEQMLGAARRAWDFIKDTGDSIGFVNPPEITTGEYPDRGTVDELFWAAAELYLAGDEELGKVLMERYSVYLRPGLGWARINSYAFYDLLQAQEEGRDMGELSAVCDACREALVQEAEEITAAAGKDAYGCALEDAYPWGSNMSVANQGIALLMAAELTDDSSYAAMAKKQADYLLGCNGLGYCFVTGSGSNSPQHPHHRPSQAAGEVCPGMLVGGPDSNLEDPYAKGVLAGQAPAMCYVDNAQSYSTNEVTIYWNSPLIWLLSAFLQ